MVLIGYARVSLPEQSLTPQIDALEGAGCKRVFVDEVAGARSGLTGALNCLAAGDQLVVCKLDRLGRTARQLVEFVELLKARDVRLRSLSDNFTGAPGDSFYHLMGSLAEMERTLLRERTAAGQMAGRARGREGGRRPKLSPSQIEAARQLLEGRGASVAEIADRFGVARSTLYRAIDRVTLSGHA